MLIDTQFCCLNPANSTYIAWATINTDKPPRQIQSTAVRQLLTWLQKTLKLQGQLIESAFPYYFIHQEIQHFVCFSHSSNQVVVIISQHPCAIDIQIQNVSIKVAHRFYHNNELNYLAILAPDEQKHLINLLWQLKECLIKLNHGQLTSGLGIDCSSIFYQLDDNQPKTLIKFNDTFWVYSNSNQHYTAVFVQ